MEFEFGKFKNKSVEQVFQENPNYCQWVYNQPMLKDSQPEIYEFLKSKLINKNDYYMTFGKYKNKSMSWIIQNDPKYIYWLRGNTYIQENCKKLATIVNGIKL